MTSTPLVGPGSGFGGPRSFKVGDEPLGSGHGGGTGPALLVVVKDGALKGERRWSARHRARRSAMLQRVSYSGQYNWSCHHLAWIKPTGLE